MKVESITLKNIGQFKDLTIPLAPLEEGKPKVTVFIGNNGSGKTTVLKSLVTALSWLPARIRTERGRGLEIPEEVIHNDENAGKISVHVQTALKDFSWVLSKSRQGKKSEFVSDLKAVSELADIYRIKLTEHELADLPLFVFYPVERSVVDIPLETEEYHFYEQLDGYDKAVEIRVNFQRFFEWFKNREDIENEERLSYEIENDSQKIDNMLNLMDKLFELWDEIQNIDLLNPRFNEIQNERQRLEKQMDLLENSKEEKIYEDVQLKAVKEAIHYFTDFENIKIQRKPKAIMSVTKNNQQLNVLQLSQGEKSLMALVGDIARRLAMLNPSLDNPLKGQGVVIIDEADLHLHPQWQRQLIARLTKTFPNCQFVLSTHSPLVISDSKDIVVYSLENGEMTCVPSQYGQDANTVLLNAMDTAIRTQDVTNKLNKIIDLIQDYELSVAKEQIAELQRELPINHLELNKAKILLKKQEIRYEKNLQNS